MTIRDTQREQRELRMKLKYMLIVKSPLHGVWIPKWKHTPGEPSAGFLLREQAAQSQASPLQPLSRLGRGGNYIISRWNESSLQGNVSEMLYCSQNCQLKSNTWNAEAQLKQTSPPNQAFNQSVLCSTEAPRDCFSFPLFPPFLPVFPVFICESCRQCSFTLAHIAHKSPSLTCS